MKLTKYQLTGHLQIAGVTDSATTAVVRVTIAAASRAEAEEKFKAFLRKKAVPVVGSCREVPATMDDMERLFRDIFSK